MDKCIKPKTVSKYGKQRIKAYIAKRYSYASESFRELKCQFLEDHANNKFIAEHEGYLSLLDKKK